jgi:hypothetical protein
LKWPATPAAAAAGRGKASDAAARGAATGADAAPVDVSAALEEAWAAFRQQDAQRPSGGGGSGLEHTTADAGAGAPREDPAAAATAAATAAAAAAATSAPAVKWSALAWHPDGRVLAAASEAGAVVVFLEVPAAAAVGLGPPPGAPSVPASAAAAAGVPGWSVIHCFHTSGFPISHLRWGQGVGGRALLAAADQRTVHVCGWPGGVGGETVVLAEQLRPQDWFDGGQVVDQKQQEQQQAQQQAQQQEQQQAQQQEQQQEQQQAQQQEQQQEQQQAPQGGGSGGEGGGGGAAPWPRVQALPALPASAKGLRDVAFAADGLVCVARGDGAIQVRGGGLLLALAALVANALPPSLGCLPFCSALSCTAVARPPISGAQQRQLALPQPSAHAIP